MPIKAIGYAFLLFIILIQSLFLSMLPHIVHATESAAIPQLGGGIEAEIQDETNPYLVISAVQITGGIGKTEEDFIELFNPTSKPFDLNGYRLVKRTAAGTMDTVVKAWSESIIVPAFHFYLWANSNFSTVSSVPDAISTGTLADNNGIALRYGANDTGEIWDSIAWGSTVNIFENISSHNPSDNESLARNDLFAETSGYGIKTSNPRNSSIEQLPLILEDEEVSDNTSIDDQSTEEENEENFEEEQNDNEDTEHKNEPKDSEAEINIRITELLPNPSGSDSGYEKIEVYNFGKQLVNLKGFKIDDVQSSQAISSNALTLDSLEIAAESYKAITIPSGSFSMNNTGGDFITIFNLSEQVVASVFYEATAPEAKSYSLFNANKWLWTGSTFGEGNGNPPSIKEDDEDADEEEEADDTTDENNNYDNSGLEITEIYPQPQKGSSEFIEIYNRGNNTAQLSQVDIYVGDRKKVLPEYELEPGDYFIIDPSSLPVQLRNSGQTVMLKYNQSILSTVTYGAAVAEASFAKFEDGFLWTMEVTNKKDNVLKIPEAIKKEVVSKSVSTPKTSAKKVAATSAKKPATTAKVNPINSTNKPEASSKPQDKEMEPENTQLVIPTSQKASMGKIIAMGAAAVTAGLFALYKLVFTVGAD